MRSVPPPEFNTQYVINSLFKRMRNEDKKSVTLNNSARLVGAESILTKANATKGWHALNQSKFTVDQYVDDWIRKIYAENLVSKASAKREIYSNLTFSFSKKCPICWCRNIETLDHYMPKSLYPLLALTPSNLIPSCFKCNMSKSASTPNSLHECGFNPYFDSTPDHQWLQAVVDSKSGTVRFNASDHAQQCNDSLCKRIEKHFTDASLDYLYGIESSQEIGSHQYSWNKIRNGFDGIEELRCELEVSHLEYSKTNKNGWRAVLYGALIESDWFLNKGFLVWADAEEYVRR